MTFLLTACEITRRRLLAAIRAEPGANDLRLIYADWLEENGAQEMADAVRVQIAFSPTTAADFANNFCRSFDADLAIKNRLAPILRNYCVLRRGFVDVVLLPLTVWDQYGPGLVANHPVQRVFLADWSPRQTHGRWRYLFTDRRMHDSLGKFERWELARNRLTDYRDENTAKQAMSNALIMWALEVAEQEGLL